MSVVHLTTSQLETMARIASALTGKASETVAVERGDGWIVFVCDGRDWQLPPTGTPPLSNWERRHA